MATAAAESIVKSYGSSSHNPDRPYGADVSTRAPVKSSVWPEVSTKPPLPPSAPPVAMMVPLKVVAPSDHTTTLPPSPAPVADALIVVAASTVTVEAVGTA